MMADLFAWALAYPVIACVLGLILWFTSGLLVTLLFIAHSVPLDNSQTLEQPDPTPAPAPWGRGGYQPKNAMPAGRIQLPPGKL